MDKAIIKQFKEYATEMLNSFFAGKNKAGETYTMDNVHSEVKAYDDILEEFGFDNNFEKEFLLPEMEKREKKKKKIEKKKIGDFGNKIQGARKELWEIYTANLNKLTAEDIADDNSSMSKLIPPPNYKKLVKDVGLSKEVVANLHLIRQYVGRKPKERVNRQERNEWAERVVLYKEILQKSISKEYGNSYDDPILDFELPVILLPISLHSDRLAKAKLLVANGFPDKSLDFHNHRVEVGISSETGEATYFTWLPRTWRYADTREEHLSRNYSIETYNEADALNYFNLLSVRVPRTPKRQKPIKFIAYYSDNHKITVATKVKGGYTLELRKLNVDDFIPIKMLSKWISDHREELVKEVEKATQIAPYRFDQNRERKGVSVRNDKNISPTDFQEEFAFDGLVWGNWVTQKERQGYMNRLYDSLTDLASILGIDKKAISFGGKLGLGIGSHGTKKASATFRFPNNDITLTKTNGAGCFAHEWGHAFDYHYTQIAYNGIYSNSNKWCSVKGYREDGGGNHLREKMRIAFYNVNTAISINKVNERSIALDGATGKKRKPYWSLAEELFARCFEWYVKTKLEEKGYINDFLVNIIPLEGYLTPKQYPYPILDESGEIIVAFDDLLKAIEVDKTSDIFTLQGIKYATN